MNKIFTLLLAILFPFSAFCQSFTPEQEDEIMENTRVLLNRYCEYADLTIDGVTISDIYKTEFKNLFPSPDTEIIYNDVTNANNYISANKYIELVEKNFEHGIEVKIDLDSAIYRKLKKITENDYSIQIICNKYTIGIDNSRKIVRCDGKVYIGISFIYNENEFSNFLITEIINENTILKQISDEKIKGFYVGINILPYVGFFALNKNIEYYSKTSSINLSFCGGLVFDYYFSTNLCIETGARYSLQRNYSSIMYNNGTNNNLPKIDADNDNFFLFINSDINEKILIKTYDFPLNFVYRMNLANQISFYFSPGINISIIKSAKFLVTGNSTHSGYYPDYHVIVDDAPNYNFGTINYSESEFDLELGKINYFANINTGISIPIKERTYLNTGFVFKSNITDIKYSKSAYRDDFYNIYNTIYNIKLPSIGFTVSYIVKL